MPCSSEIAEGQGMMLYAGSRVFLGPFLPAGGSNPARSS